MKAFYLSTVLTLALAGAAQANETFPNSSIANGISTTSSEAVENLENCLTDESSSRAVRACTKAIRSMSPMKSVKSELYTQRGLHQMALGRQDHAMRDFERASQLADDNELATLGQGFAAMLSQDFSVAKVKFEDCKNQGRLAPLAEYGLGLTFQMTGETEQAQDAYDRALDLRPGWTAVAEQIETLK